MARPPQGWCGLRPADFPDDFPMTQITIDDIKRDLAAYFRLVAAGETLIILAAGEPFAEIKHIATAPASLRPFGLCAGQFVVPDDFDAPLPDDLLGEFDGQ
ncbi:MAG: type II toxin-antitoxin system Phd/YefM family antitoxin [Blastocatellia bacterium]